MDYRCNLGKVILFGKGRFLKDYFGKLVVQYESDPINPLICENVRTLFLIFFFLILLILNMCMISFLIIEVFFDGLIHFQIL